MRERENLLNLTPDDAQERLAAAMSELGAPRYRVDQVMRNLWSAPAEDFSTMLELPAVLRESLAERFALPRLELVARQRSTDGTQKFLFRLRDGEAIETVAIPDGNRVTLCISSQAGCALRCAFCATGAMGFSRNLEVFEIAGQVREMRLIDEPIEITNIVFMGMGEPMMNWKAVDPALTLLNDQRALGIGARHITISTVGVLPGIVALGKRREQFRLAISIHAPTDALRQQLMPVNTKFPLAEVLRAAKVFDRRVTFEYVMLGGVNDLPEHARLLAELARECKAFVNLIPLHPGGSQGFVPTTPQAIAKFARQVRDRGVEIAIRKSRGIDIAAACGQLRVERLGRRAPRAAEQHGDIQIT
ncbi:MAG: 23S rRNA (adenine(2503)-C(2))-methyltransferase RlmN [Gemmatimonadaceae bacterium]|nr:23S rRNA (adenine(2503)-C(2))-methyltransferase RlmN [Gemmatimonadaceae bacterium]